MDDRQSPINEEKSWDSFLKLTQNCTDNDTVSNVERMRACSQPVWQYVVLYKAVELIDFDGHARNRQEGDSMNKY